MNEPIPQHYHEYFYQLLLPYFTPSTSPSSHTCVFTCFRIHPSFLHLGVASGNILYTGYGFFIMIMVASYTANLASSLVTNQQVIRLPILIFDSRPSYLTSRHWSRTNMSYFITCLWSDLPFLIHQQPSNYHQSIIIIIFFFTTECRDGDFC